MRVSKKRKTFDKGYKPRWSSVTYPIDRREGKYYIIADDTPDPKHELRADRTYLRAHIQLVKGDVQHNPSKGDLVGTLEGRLKEQGKLPIDESSVQEKERIEKEAQEEIRARIERLKARRRKKKRPGALA